MTKNDHGSTLLGISMFWGSANNSNGYLRYVQGLGKVGTKNVVGSTFLDISIRYEYDPGDFIDRVVTQDETWIHHFDPESKMQSMQLKHTGSHPSQEV